MCELGLGSSRACAHRGDAASSGASGVDAGRIDRSLIHAARVEVGDLALRRPAGSPVLLRERFDQVADEDLVLLFEQRVDAPVGAVRAESDCDLIQSAVRETEKSPWREAPQRSSQLR